MESNCTITDITKLEQSTSKEAYQTQPKSGTVPAKEATAQWRRKEIIAGGAQYGGAPGRVREGGTPPAQLGGMGERCKLPHRGLGLRPRSQRFLRLKNSKNYAKKWRPRKRPIGLY